MSRLVARRSLERLVARRLRQPIPPQPPRRRQPKVARVIPPPSNPRTSPRVPQATEQVSVSMRSLLAFTRTATEFPSEKALKKYLKEHPKADKSKHKVVKPKRPKKEEEPAKERKKKEEEPPAEAAPAPEEAPPAAKPPAPAGAPQGTPAIDVSKYVELPLTGATEGVKTSEDLFAKTSEAHEQQLDFLDRGSGIDAAIGARVVRIDQGEELDLSEEGPVVVIGPVKEAARSEEKVNADYGGDWSKLTDTVRASVAVDSFDDMTELVKTLEDQGMKLAAQPTDRFAQPTEAGYRDVKLNVEFPNGLVGELQLHVKSMLEAKSEGHDLYKQVRTVEAAAESEGRRELTDEEQSTVDEANGAMRELYDEAWEKVSG